VYPYRSRSHWILSGRYAHLAKAVHQRRTALQDSVLEQRVLALEGWNTVRFAISVLLSIGIVAAALSSIAHAVPGGLDDGLIRAIVATSTYLTGGLTLAYLFLTRLLGQLEIDILAILTVEHH
jgi:hypothetical protein